MRRMLPVFGLFFISPLVAEYLLGDFPITMIGLLAILAPLYGGGALLIREIVRRRGGGWANILLFALAYAVLSEAIINQTLFNPDYLGMHMHLLMPAYIPQLGIGAWWTVFVLTLHTVWSISVPIALTEAVVPDRASDPWLGRVGTGVFTGLFVVASVAVFRSTIQRDAHHFMASGRQLAASTLISIVVTVAAILLPRLHNRLTQTAVPGPWWIGLSAFAAGVLFWKIPGTWGWKAVGAYFLLDLFVLLIVFVLSGSANWERRHRLALASGAALTYAWHGFLQKPLQITSATITLAGHILFALGAVAVIVAGARRERAFALTRSPSPLKG